MGSHPSECFVLEDAPKGIEAAKRADMFCVGLTTTFPAPLLAQSDIIVDAFADLALEELGV
jgi:beta-phosphoglucomutase-like phosphatase (HAD superfamily)